MLTNDGEDPLTPTYTVLNAARKLLDSQSIPTEGRKFLCPFCGEWHPDTPVCADIIEAFK